MKVKINKFAKINVEFKEGKDDWTGEKDESLNCWRVDLNGKFICWIKGDIEEGDARIIAIEETKESLSKEIRALNALLSDLDNINIEEEKIS